MAQTGYTPISIYYSSTAAATPTAGNLVAGELAINTADGKLFYKDSAGVVQVIGTKGGVGSSTTTQVLYNSSGLVVGSANLTFNGTTLTVANDASISGLTVGKGGGAISTNTSIGVSALSGTATGTNNTAVGNTAMGNAAVTGSANTALGSRSAFSLTSGNYNHAIGEEALYANTTGSSNTAVGFASLYANTTASNNTAVGYQACYSNTTGAPNTAVGVQALYTNTTGTNNSAIGTYALQVNTTGGSNTAIGHGSLVNNTTASNNTAVGYQAGYTGTTGYSNTYLGYQAGYSATTGFYNTLVGQSAGRGITTGNQNLMVGNDAGFSLTTGIRNTFVGCIYDGVGAAGYFVTTGSKNTILGAYNGNQGGLDIRTASNYIVLSDGDGNPRGVFDNTGRFLVGTANAQSPGSIAEFYSTSNNQSFVIRSNPSSGSSYVQELSIIPNTSDTTSRFLSCDSNSGNSQKLYIYSNGNVVNANNSYGAISDISLKENIVDASPKLEDLAKVQIRNFNYIDDENKQKQIGVVAQELETIFPSMIDVDGETGTKSVKYSVFVPMLIKAVQELKAEVDSLKQQLGK